MKNYTVDELKSWAGSDFTRDELFDLLTDIANGVYRIEQFRQDLEDWAYQREAP